MESTNALSELGPCFPFIVLAFFLRALATMAHCFHCSSVIIKDDQYYRTDDITPEITAILEQNLGHEITEDAKLCVTCFTNAMQKLASLSDIKNDPIALPPETNVCVMCRLSLFKRRSHMFADVPQRQLISERIPEAIPDGSRVCNACWVHIQRMLKEQGIVSVPTVNTNICVWCQVSLSQRRRHNIPEGPERDEILHRIYPRQIPPGGLVCYACWVSARRNVQREIKQKEKIGASLDPGPPHSHYRDACVWCDTSLFRRQTHILTGALTDIVAARIYPIELPERALVCSNCFTRAQENLQIEQGTITEVTSTVKNTMTLDNFSHTTSSSSCCFVPGCRNPERLRVPDRLKKTLLNSKKLFVTKYSRVCAEHKSVTDWEFLDQCHFTRTFTKVELEAMLLLSIKEIGNNK